MELLLRTSSVALRAVSMAVCIATLSSVVEAQTTWVVSGDRQQFHVVMSKVAAGDTVLIRKGTYYGGQLTRPMTVLCDPGVRMLPTPGRTIAGLSIGYLPYGQDIRVVGGEWVGPSDIKFCKGSVILEECRLEDLSVVGNHRCSFHDCSIGRTHVTYSNAAFSDCEITGSCTQGSKCGALSIDHSCVTISGGSVLGQGWPLSAMATPGIEFNLGELTISGDAAIHGGAPDASAIHSPAGKIRLGQSVQLLNSSGPLIRGSASVQREQFPSIVTKGVAAGQRFSVTASAEPGSILWVLVSRSSDPILTPFGMLWASPGRGEALDLGPVPASGIRTTSFIVPQLAKGLEFTIQPLSLNNGHKVLVGPSATVVTR